MAETPRAGTQNFYAMNTEEKEIKWLTTAETAKMLGVHRNTLYTFAADLQPMKALNGKDNQYDQEKVKALLKKRKEQNPKIRL